MAATPPPMQEHFTAPDFQLPATDGRVLRYADIQGENGTVIIFICNHCPYVLAIVDRLVNDAKELMAAGIGFAAICSNDSTTYPEDSFHNMKRFAEENAFPFPYLHDEDQSVAKAYDAVCTPDPFGFDRDNALAYRGRLDAGRRDPPPAGSPRELVDAMLSIANGGAPDNQVPSMGCSIKWKPN